MRHVRSNLLVAAAVAAVLAVPQAAAVAAPAKEVAAAPAKPATTKAPAKAPAKAAKVAEPPKPGELVKITGQLRAPSVSMALDHFVLANGLRVYVLEDHSVPTYAMYIAYNVGSRDEEPGRSGFAHFFEHMMFKGSANVADGGYFRTVLGAGGQMNAFTANDLTVYFNLMPSQYLDTSLWLESDRLRSLAITDENFENQRSAVKEEKAMRVDNVPYAKSIQDFFAEAWAGTGYGHPAIGSDEDLGAATTADVKAFFERYYVPNNAVMVLVGDVNAAEVQTKVDKAFGDIPRGADRQPSPKVDHTQKKLEKRYDDKLAQQPLLLVGWKTVPSDHPDRHALELLVNVLLRGESARITKILVDEKKLAVAAVPLPSGASGGRDAGSVFAAFVPAQGVTSDQIEQVILADIDDVKKKGIPRPVLQKAINQMVADTVMGLSSNEGRALQIAYGALFENDPVFVLSDVEKYRAVKPADIKRVANTYLTSEWMTAEVVPAK
jgi:zinc protease